MAACGKLFVGVLLGLMLGLPVFAAEPENTKSTTGLPLPRFASLRSDEVNMRTGPGTRYPIEWVYRKPGLPVEIVAEFEIWRRVRDWEGAEGWVHKASLIGKRTAIITARERQLRTDDQQSATIAATLQHNALGEIQHCGPDWCELKFGSVTGYLPKAEFWGVYANEIIK